MIDDARRPGAPDSGQVATERPEMGIFWSNGFLIVVSVRACQKPADCRASVARRTWARETDAGGDSAALQHNKCSSSAAA